MTNANNENKTGGKKEIVVVIGCNSFSGASYVDFLLETGKYHVIGMSRSAKKDIYLPYKRNPNIGSFEFHQLDLNKDLDAMLQIIRDNKAKYVVNFASQSMVGESWQFPLHWYKTNVLSTVALLEGLNNMRVKDKEIFMEKYVHISTPEVYGSCSGSVTENAPFNPSSPYAASREAGDVFLKLLIKQYGFPAVFTRAANVYGDGQQLFRIIPRAIIYMKKGIKIPLHGGGFAERSFIHIRDVCQGTLDVMEKAKIGETYHLSTDKLISVRDIVRKIAERMGKNYDDAVDVVGTRPGLDMAYILDSAKAKKDFNWAPTIELDEGIDGMIAWIDRDWDIIQNEPLEYQHKE
ncbi:MAG TPA: GDP-mannose 4,6-dehydratase [Alphaproteobacteria bacterium]|nr:GDP-mannose 4,6-dehydratase [Alphaproteobacteria bacterium]